MLSLQEVLAKNIPVIRDDVKSLVSEHGDKVISEVTVQQAYGGMRGVKGLVCDTSLVDPETGLSVRGIPIGELTERLPEEIFYLLCTGELPDRESLADLQKDLMANKEVPQSVWNVLKTMPADSHPMTMLSVAILSLQNQSAFVKKYSEGIRKTDYWIYVLEDAVNLLAKLPMLAAGIYRIRFGKGDLILQCKAEDWGASYAECMGVPDPKGEFANLMRLYLVLHCDHEGGNVSANTCHTVGSALSDPYLAVSAGLNGLAGPLHGLANQECLRFVLRILDKYGKVPTEDQLKEFAWETLNSGSVIPGYGHAVLRATDPRFTAFHAFGKRVCPDDPVFKTVDMMFQIVPNILMEHGKAKNPWPNVDAGSGSLLYHFGVKEFSYYTVLFAVSRSMGMLSQLIMNRALGTPITRPKSVTTDWIKEQVGAKRK